MLAFGVALCCGCSDGSTQAWNGGSSSGSSGGSSSGSSSGSPSGSSSGSSGSSSGGSSGSSGSIGNDSGPTSDDGGTAESGTDDAASDAPVTSNRRESLVWIPTYLNGFSANLQSVTSNPGSFTIVAPDFYDLNFNYMSGPPNLGSESYDNMTIAQIVQQVHQAGIRITPLMYAGAGNSGTDQGIQNVLNDSPSGTQNNFITGLVSEAQTRGYDGWDLDWEVGNTGYAQYGMKYVSFLTALKAALHAHDMVVSITVGDWYIRQCGGDGLVDLTQIGPAVDRVIIMDYAGSYGSPVTSCPGGTPAAQQNCNNDFGALMNVMCSVSPSSAVSIGLIQGSNGSGTNPFLDQALNAIDAVGFTGVAAWPDDNPFLSNQNIPNGATWFSLLATYMAE